MKNLPVLKDHEIMSDMTFPSPAICSGTKPDALRTWIRRPSICSNLPATMNVEVRSLFVHETAEELSQKTPMWWYAMESAD